MVELNSIKKLVVPEGAVKKVYAGGTTLWKKTVIYTLSYTGSGAVVETRYNFIISGENAQVGTSFSGLAFAGTYFDGSNSCLDGYNRAGTSIVLTTGVGTDVEATYTYGEDFAVWNNNNRACITQNNSNTILKAYRVLKGLSTTPSVSISGSATLTISHTPTYKSLLAPVETCDSLADVLEAAGYDYDNLLLTDADGNVYSYNDDWLPILQSQ